MCVCVWVRDCSEDIIWRLHYENSSLLLPLMCCWFWAQRQIVQRLLCDLLLPVDTVCEFYLCVCVRLHWNVMMSNLNATDLDVFNVFCNYKVLYMWNWMHWAHECVLMCVCFMTCVNKHLMNQLFYPTCFVTLFLLSLSLTHTQWMGSRCAEHNWIFQFSVCRPWKNFVLTHLCFPPFEHNIFL